ncbi:MAG: RusA family crossover junction endodeoxyribonuclease [Clostridia bacterium]|nr:RusA family crossover junction endodeoxyribonuclease [Clostridia bacterium]
MSEKGRKQNCKYCKNFIWCEFGKVRFYTTTDNKCESFEADNSAFEIPLPPISKKNSQQIAINRRTGRPFIVPSKQYKEYEKQAMLFIPKQPCEDYPVNVKCLFYMPTKRKCDLVNMLEAVDDVLVKAGYLTDDNYTVIAGHNGSRVLYDKENPRTEIYITKV